MSAFQDDNNHHKKFKCLMKILKNILNNPTDGKYTNLNLSRITKTFKDYPIYLHFLYDAGFYKSDDNKRLVHDIKHINELKSIYIQLSTIDYQYIKQIDPIIDRKEVRFINKIFKNIMDNPNNIKYSKLVLSILEQKLKSSKCINILFKSGFYKSDDGKYLIHDTKYIHKLQLIYTQLSTLTTKTPCKSHITARNAEYLLSPCKLNHPQYEYHCNLLECPHLQIIRNVIKQYHCYIQTKSTMNNNETRDIYGDVYGVVSSNYQNSNLLNDFNHLLLYHSTQFEEIYDILNQFIYKNNGCKLVDCRLMFRNQRDRSQVTNNKILLCDLYFGNNDTVEQQLLDRIHCYYFHSFDIGYKIDKKKKLQIINQNIEFKSNEESDTIIIGIYDLIRSKQAVYQRIDGLERLKMKRNKFLNQTNSNSLNEYSYGFRYFYWDYCKNNHYDDEFEQDPKELREMPFFFRKITANDGFSIGEWYVGKKNDTLKEELLQNEICCIIPIQWENLMKKALAYADTIQVRQTTSNSSSLRGICRIESNATISKNHLIAMMVQCEFDILQRKFGETFRLKSDDETYEELKKRHSNYYWLARLLRECVECFGMNGDGLHYKLDAFHFH
eukprot:210047_1